MRGTCVLLADCSMGKSSCRITHVLELGLVAYGVFVLLSYNDLLALGGDIFADFGSGKG
jgi:hypothetical protein